MFDEKIDELFEIIENSDEYKEFKKAEEVLSNSEELVLLIEEIKLLQKEATLLELEKDAEYKKIDGLIKDKLDYLNSFPTYVDYINKKEEMNEILSNVCNSMNKYIDEIIK